jgi:hypothetical protein
MANNQPAFPQNNDRVVASISIANSQGMTLRDYFAAKAMQAMTERGEASKGFVAREAYLMADAMLKARNENNRQV